MCSSKLMTLFDYLLIILLILIWWLIKNLKFITPGVQFLQGDHQLFHENNSIFFYKLENLKKAELIDKIQEIDSKKHLEKSTINKLSLSEIRKLYFKKVIFLISKMWTFLSKLTIFSIFLKVILNFKLMRFIWILFSSLITFVFGLAYSEIYGFKVIFDEIMNYFSYAIDYIHGFKFYHILTKILTSIKNVNEESIKDQTNTIESVIKTEVKETPSSFMTTNNPSSTGNEISVTENKVNNRWDNKQEVINEYRNKYSILICLFLLAGLTWFLWDDIKLLLSSISPGKPDLGGNEDNKSGFLDYQEEYFHYFKELEVNDNLYDLEVIRAQSNKVEYLDVENSKWVDSPTTPKASSSKLPSSQGVMLPISK